MPSRSIDSNEVSLTGLPQSEGDSDRHFPGQPLPRDHRAASGSIVREGGAISSCFMSTTIWALPAAGLRTLSVFTYPVEVRNVGLGLQVSLSLQTKGPLKQEDVSRLNGLDLSASADVSQWD